MVSKTERKLIEIGGSQLIVLPHDWIAGMELRTGDKVEVLYDEDVTIKVKKEAKRE